MEGFIGIPNARLVSDGGVLVIEVSGRIYTVSLYQVAWEQSMPGIGERGTLLMRREFAERLGLVEASA
jgi:hypothetical protein